MFSKKYATNINRIRNNTIMRRRKLFDNGVVRMKHKFTFSAPDKYYGLAEPLDDFLILCNEDMVEKKNEFLKKLQNVDRIDIEKLTRDQNQSQLWFKERKIRLTASKFGEVCKMRDNTSCKNKVHGILYKPPATCKSLAYGIEMEPFARTNFEKLYQVHVELCGLFIDREYPFLAASPGNTIT